MYIFGGDKHWSSSEWTASDDRVRGGASQSYLECHDGSPTTANFHGNLDIETLGGAGFASQRTTTHQCWDLSKYDGISLHLGKSDGKKYTFILKDEVLPKSPNGREQSTISWEYDFEGPAKSCKVFIPWKDFKATYRGRDKPDAEPINLKNIKRISFMMRSFFGSQHGDFSLTIVSVSATTSTPNLEAISSQESQGSSYDEKDLQQPTTPATQPKHSLSLGLSTLLSCFR